MKRILHCFIFFLLSTHVALCLAPALEREVNLSFNNERITVVFARIQDQTGLVFSYQPALIANIGPVTIQFKQKTVREVLSLILPKNILFKSKNNYIILKEKIPVKEEKKTEVSGYVYDKKTDKKLSNVTIYDKNTLQSVTTNEYGYYSIKVPNNNECLSVGKENYRDTCLSLATLKQEPINNIIIDQVSDTSHAPDSTKWKQKLRDFGTYTNNLFKSFKGYINTLNVRDTFLRNFQMSFLPFIGSNGLMSGNVYNRYSINVIGGYSRGTHGLEVGSLFNVNRGEMKGAQLAGMFNIVGDTSTGVQLAGLFNITGRYMKGYQGAGFLNLNIGNLKGVQTAGLINMNIGNVDGFQAAGMLNLNTKGVNGVCAAGLININRYSVRGVQVAGMMNVTGDTILGVSVAGLLNVNWYSKNSLEVAGAINTARYGENNVQIASLINSTHKGTTNLQISGFINTAHHVRGLQIGLFNYADTVSGVPLGLFSVVKKGLHEIEVSFDETFPVNVTYKSGVNLFHNILTAGTQTFFGGDFWNIGYGVGTKVGLGKRFKLDASAIASHISSGGLYFATSELYRFYAGIEFTVSKKFKIGVGPTFNMYWSDKLLPDYTGTYSRFAPVYAVNRDLKNDFNLKSWFGARVAVRLF